MTENDKMVSCIDNAFARFANSCASALRRWERVIYPTMCAVGIAGIAAFYLIWSMNRHVGIMQEKMTSITDQIETMTRAVGNMDANMQGMGFDVNRLANNVTAMTGAVNALEDHTGTMSAHTLGNLQQLKYPPCLSMAPSSALR